MNVLHLPTYFKIMPAKILIVIIIVTYEDYVNYKGSS